MSDLTIEQINEKMNILTDNVALKAGSVSVDGLISTKFVDEKNTMEYEMNKKMNLLVDANKSLINSNTETILDNTNKIGINTKAISDNKTNVNALTPIIAELYTNFDVVTELNKKVNTLINYPALPFIADENLNISELNRRGLITLDSTERNILINQELTNINNGSNNTIQNSSSLDLFYSENAFIKNSTTITTNVFENEDYEEGINKNSVITNSMCVSLKGTSNTLVGNSNDVKIDFSGCNGNFTEYAFGNSILNSNKIDIKGSSKLIANSSNIEIYNSSSRVIINSSNIVEDAANYSGSLTLINAHDIDLIDFSDTTELRNTVIIGNNPDTLNGDLDFVIGNGEYNKKSTSFAVNSKGNVIIPKNASNGKILVSTDDNGTSEWKDISEIPSNTKKLFVSDDSNVNVSLNNSEYSGAKIIINDNTISEKTLTWSNIKENNNGFVSFINKSDSSKKIRFISYNNQDIKTSNGILEKEVPAGKTQLFDWWYDGSSLYYINKGEF